MAPLCCQSGSCPRKSTVVAHTTASGVTVHVEFARLLPCNHVYCGRCLSHRLARREQNMHCACCGVAVVGHKYTNANNETYDTDHFDLDPCPDRDAYQFLRAQVQAGEASAATRLSLAFVAGEQPAVMTAAFDRETKRPLTANDNSALIGILALLHPYLLSEMAPSNAEETVDAPFIMSPQELCRFAFYDDNRDLTKYLFAITTGYKKVDMERMRLNPSYQSKFLASFVASEMLARANSIHPQRLQLLVSDTLQAHKVPTKMIRFFSRMRLCADEKTLNDVASDSICTLAMQGKRAHRWELIMWIIDNLGFRKKVGYDQWTIVENIVITLDELIKARIYHPTQPLSRQRSDLPELIQRDGIDVVESRVLDPRDEDVKTLCQYSLAHIKYAMELKVPTHDDCMEMEAERVWCTSMCLFKNLGVDLDVQERIEARTSIYDRNNMVPQPVHADLSKADVVADLTKSCMKASKNLVSAPDRCNMPGFVRNSDPIQNLITPIVGDGAPVYLATRQAKDDPVESGPRWIFGGLHLQIESLNIHGRLFHETRGYVVSKYRETPGRWNWIMHPRSPDDPMKELLPYVLAHQRAAADCCAEALNREASPAEVLEHQLACAKANPNSLFALMELKYATVLLMLRDSEKAGSNGDVTLFIACLRFSLPFFAVTNAYRYVEIGCDFLVWWETASPCERVLFKQFVYTRQSENGLPIWSDRCIEWTMKHIRQFMGKVRRPGHDARMNRTVAELPWREGGREPESWMSLFASTDMTDLDGDASESVGRCWNDLKLEGFGVTEIYALTYNHLRRQRLWELPAAGEVIAQLNNPKGELLNSSLLEAFPLGLRRLKHRFRKTYASEESGSDDGSDDGDSALLNMNCIPCTAVRELTEQKNRETALISCSREELSKLPPRCLTKEEVIKEVKELQSFYTHVLLPPKSQPKGVWIDLLCQLREDYFSIFPHVVDEVKLRLRQETNHAMESTREEREEILASSFFRKNQQVMDAFSAAVDRNTKPCFG